MSMPGTGTNVESTEEAMKGRGGTAAIEAWVFDLDDTLYPPSAGVLRDINARMTRFIARELGLTKQDADDLRVAYWRSYGATLTGLVERHGVDAAAFLSEVHAVDLAALKPDPSLARRIGELPGRRIVMTNGSRAYAARVLAARGLEGVFDAVVALDDRAFHAKPRREAYEALIDLTGLAPDRAVMIDDSAANLRAPKALGMRTVRLGSYGGAIEPWVDHVAPSLDAALLALG